MGEVEASAVPAAEAPSVERAGSAEGASGRRFWVLTLGSLGVVYGDIGTSPLYALRESLAHARAGGVTRPEVLGVVSLLLWALILIVTVKYVLFLLRADNRGEGGTLALLALARAAIGRRTLFVLVLAMIGAALFYGDALITPAISVLSALEGMNTVTPAFAPYVVPATVAILLLLFAVQGRGTGAVARFFGPITALWFVVMAIAGLRHIGDDPGILAAFNPWEGVRFMLNHGTVGFMVLGSVFLAVTGAEALYADMGHFGRGPIRTAWLGLVLPALAINYLGQGALVLARPEALDNPFFNLVDDPWRLPLVVLAAAATVIASQAVITGAFSLTRQAVQLGLLPRFEVRHTSEKEAGQIYLPRLNRQLLVGVVLLVLLFGSSTALASAYGIAVTGTMVVTTLLAFVIVWRAWRLPLPLALLVCLPFLAIELLFLAANMLKILDGGWVPLLVAATIVSLMAIWVHGVRLVNAKAKRDTVSTTELVKMLVDSKSLLRTPGTAVYLTSDRDVAPRALLHNIKHNHVLHEQNIFLTVNTASTPRVAPDHRIRIEDFGDGFRRIDLTFGFMETPNVPKALAACRKQGLGIKFDIMSTSFFLSRRHFRAVRGRGLPRVLDAVFVALTKNSANVTDFYRLPAERVVEMGQQIMV